MNLDFIQNIINTPKKKRTAVLLSGLGVLAFVLIFSSHGISKRISLEFENNSLKNEISALKLEKDSMKRAINRLYVDTLEIERIAREKYGMIKKGEKIIFIKKED